MIHLLIVTSDRLRRWKGNELNKILKNFNSDEGLYPDIPLIGVLSANLFRAASSHPCFVTPSVHFLPRRAKNSSKSETNRMPVNIPGLLANMSNSLGAYLRPSRPPLPFTSSNSNGHGYYDDPNMPKDPWRKQGTRRRFIIRWCLLPALLISLLFLWFTRGAQKKPEPPEPPKTPDPPPPIPTVDPFENCARVIEEMGIPSVENITKLQPASASSTMTTTNGKPYKSHKLPSPVGSDDPRKWAREVSPAELMEMVESGEHPGPRILHQSWKPGPLPPHFERWSAKWKKQLDETWLYVVVASSTIWGGGSYETLTRV